MPARVVLGNCSGAYGLWVSKPGKNVLTETDPKSFLFDIASNQTIFGKPFAAGIITGYIVPTANADPSVVTISHNLGFIPLVYMETTDPLSCYFIWDSGYGNILTTSSLSFTPFPFGSVASGAGFHAFANGAFLYYCIVNMPIA